MAWNFSEIGSTKTVIIMALGLLFAAIAPWKWFGLNTDEVDKVIINNIVYEVQNATNSQGSLLMIHLDKQAQWSALPKIEKQGYQGRDDYYRKTAIRLLNWASLSGYGKLFLNELLETAFGPSITVLLTRQDFILVHLKMQEAYVRVVEEEAIDRTGANKCLAFQLHLMTLELLRSPKVIGLEMRHFSDFLRA